MAEDSIQQPIKRRRGRRANAVIPGTPGTTPSLEQNSSSTGLGGQTQTPQGQNPDEATLYGQLGATINTALMMGLPWDKLAAYVGAFRR